MPTDNFNRADGALGSNWVYVGGYANMQIKSNGCAPYHSGRETAHCWAGNAPTADHKSQVTITDIGSGGDQIGVCVRASSPDSYYAFIAGPFFTQLLKRVAGTWSAIGSMGSGVVVGDVIALEVTGNQLRPMVNGATWTAIGIQTDTSLTTGTYGIAGQADNGRIIADSWVGTPEPLLNQFTINAASGSHSVSGATADTVLRRLFPALLGTYAADGSAAVLFEERPFTVSPGACTVNGIVAALQTTGALAANTGIYSVTGYTASLEKRFAERILSANPGIYSVFATADLVRATGCFAYLKASENVFEDATIATVSSLVDPNHDEYKAITLPVSQAAHLLRIWEDGFYLTTPGAATPVNFLAICGHNLTPAAVIRVMASTTVPRPGVPNIIGYMPWSESTAFMMFDPPITARYWTLHFYDPTNTFGFLRVGYIIAGDLKILPLNPLRTWGFAEDFMNTKEATNWGRRFSKKGPRMARVRIEFAELLQREADLISDFMRDLDGDVQPLFLIPDKHKYEGWFGYVANSINEKRDKRVSTVIEFQEDSEGKSTPDPQPLLYNAGDDITPLGGVWTREPVVTTSYQTGGAGVEILKDYVIRDSHYPVLGHRTVLLEHGALNNMLWSQQLNVFPPWGMYHTTILPGSGAAAITGITGPNRYHGADKLQEDAANDAHVMYCYTPWLTDNTIVVYSFYVKPGERTWMGIHTADKAGGGYRSWINVAAGTVGTVSSAHTIRLRALADGWIRVSVKTPTGTGASASYMQVECGPGDGVTYYQGVPGWGLYFWGFQGEIIGGSGLLDCTSYVPNYGATAATRPKDTLTFPFPPGVIGSLTIYMAFIERRMALAYNAGALAIGVPGSPGAWANPTIWIDTDAGNCYRVVHFNNGGFLSTSAVTVPTAINDLVELRATVDEGGGVQLYQTINNGAEVAGAYGGAGGLPSWPANSRVHVGNSRPNDPVNYSTNIALKSIKIVRGGHTLDEMRQW